MSSQTHQTDECHTQVSDETAYVECLIDSSWDQRQQDEHRQLSEDPAYIEWLNQLQTSHQQETHVNGARINKGPKG